LNRAKEGRTKIWNDQAKDILNKTSDSHGGHSKGILYNHDNYKGFYITHSTPEYP
jgi:hypothetical protein